MKIASIAACAVLAAFLVFVPAGFAGAAGHGGMSGSGGHEGMPGMQGHGDMQGGDHGKMGDKIYGGKVGHWQGEARLIDMKAQMEKAMSSGMKMEGKMKSHHIAIFLTDAKTKKPVTEGKGFLTVIGPDKKETKMDIAAMAGHFGADVDLPKPGKYTFKVAIESGKEKGTATFSHTVK